MEKITTTLSAILFATFLTCTFNVTNAQNIDKLEKSAEKKFIREDFTEALEAYQLILKDSANHPLALYRAEICSLLTYYPTKPLKKLKEYAKEGGKGDKFLYYWIGRVNLKKHNFDAAGSYLTKFLKIKEFKSPMIITETKELIQLCKNGKRFYNLEDEAYRVNHLGSHINSGMDELSPTVCSDNNLLFLSSQGEEDINHKKEIFTAYLSQKNIHGWKKPFNATVLGKFNFNSSGLATFADGNKVAFTDFEAKADLKYCTKNNGKWSESRVIDEKLSKLGINKRFCLSNDGKRMIFSSIKLNFQGDYDLYEIRKERDGSWSAPTNLGARINSFHNEASPYLTADGKTLYFSSTGHGAIGGYDIFRSVLLKDGSWSEPEQLPYPINTIDDDIDYTEDRKGGGYFSSDRYGTKGGFDVFHFTMEEKPVLAKENINLDIYGDKSLHQVVKNNEGLENKSLSADNLENIYFGFNDYKLDEEARSYLKKLARLIKTTPGAVLELSSHTDNMGSKERNDELSEKRAKSVVRYLRNCGVNSVMVTKIKGDAEPLAASNDSKNNELLNRRVEMVLLK